MLPREMRTDVMPGALNASSPADESVEATPVPTLPTQDVLPKAVPVTLSLIEPASTLTQALTGAPCRGHQKTPLALLGPQSPSDEQNPV